MKTKDDVINKIIYKAIRNIIIWTIILLVIFSLIRMYLNLAEFQWLYDLIGDYYYDLKYNYLNKNLLFTIVFTIWLSGIFVILCQLIFKFKSFIKNLVNAINDIYNKDILYIELPKELEPLQQKLNNFKRESEKNERLARENEQKKNDLIVYLAHDLKTPLTSIIGYLSLLDEVEDMPKKQQNKYLKISLDKAYKLEELINELFDIARFNSETIVINKEVLNINMMFEQLIDDFYPLLKEMNKNIFLEINEKIEIMGDSSKLARVFSNLIKNAIYYSQDDRIDIKIYRNINTLHISVRNKGVIPSDKLDKIFEKFYRADYSRNSKTGGSGLGLAIAKEIVLLHNGNIYARTNDKYTTFYIELPI